MYLSVDSGKNLPPLSTTNANSMHDFNQQKVHEIMSQCHAQSNFADKPLKVSKKRIAEMTEDQGNAAEAYQKLQGLYNRYLDQHQTTRGDAKS